MATSNRNPVPIPGVASIKDKLEALKAVSDSGKSTQETHRKAIDADTCAMERLMDMLDEQSMKAESTEERETIRREATEAVAQHAQRVDSHKQDSNSVFKQVMGFGAVALGLAAATGLAVLKLRK